MLRYVRFAAVGAMLGAAALVLAACGADPGQVAGGVAPPAAGGSGGIAGLLNSFLPSVLTAIGVPSGLAGAIPVILNVLKNQRAKADQTIIETQNSAMGGLLQLLPVAVEAVRARPDNKVDDGVELLKSLFSDRIATLGIGDGALRQLVQAKLGPQPPA